MKILCVTYCNKIFGLNNKIPHDLSVAFKFLKPCCFRNISSSSPSLKKTTLYTNTEICTNISRLNFSKPLHTPSYIHTLLNDFKNSAQTVFQTRGFKTNNRLLFMSRSRLKTVEDLKKDFFEDKSLTEKEKERLKLAFAEGYLQHEIRRGPPLFIKLLKVAALIGVFAIVGYYIAESVSIEISQKEHKIRDDGKLVTITFNDVKGVEEAKEELKDIVLFLKRPESFNTIGAKLPKGVLLIGPPGTGKTLLARAVAGEAGVPFYQVAGPEFEEVLVGLGARRVRDLFRTAKENAPCVIFIDEIDSVGAQRTNSPFHPYANQTINQLLKEMDGFEQNEGVIVLGATNRKEDLDAALLRSGRFDIQVNVPVPDLAGRKDIFLLYLNRIKCCKDIDVDVLARGTTGFTGAEISNLVNQAALQAAINGLSSVSMKFLEEARDKILMGPEMKTRVPDKDANKITAYHESGHATVAYFTQGSNPLHKVTIIPRGQSLGHTAYIPEKEMYHFTKLEALAMIDTMMGGRAAEEIIFGSDKVTSGAYSDLKQATSLATSMVKYWGMSEKAGLRTYPNSGSSMINELSAQANETIDLEIQRILQESYVRAKKILKKHKLEHKLLAEALLKYETLNAADIKVIMTTRKPLPVPQESPQKPMPFRY
uniref:AAA+ ATPase domain-containing protein n=1 Tax=Clastoptera arizonana TaxID=38151 RepID=A0A1B6CTU2_9HEMI